MRSQVRALSGLWTCCALGMLVCLSFVNAEADPNNGLRIMENEVPIHDSPHTLAPESPPTSAVKQTPFVLPKTAVSALLVIDVQNCFLPGGAIPVPDGDSVIPVINKVRDTYNFRSIALSMDWHCDHHISFKTTHPGSSSPVLLTYKRNPHGGPPELCDTSGAGIYEPVVNCSSIVSDPADYVSFNQSLWPPHCIQNTKGARLASSLYRDDGSDYIVKKGTICDIDSYSAFEDNGGLDQTELQELLQEQGVNTVFVTGLALDVCVKHTSLDAKKLGYDVYVILDGARSTAEDKTMPTVKELELAGIQVILSKDLPIVGLRRQPPKWVSLFLGIPLLFMAFAIFGLLVRFLMRPQDAHRFEEATTTDDDRKPLLID